MRGIKPHSAVVVPSRGIKWVERTVFKPQLCPKSSAFDISCNSHGDITSKGWKEKSGLEATCGARMSTQTASGWGDCSTPTHGYNKIITVFCLVVFREVCSEKHCKSVRAEAYAHVWPRVHIYLNFCLWTRGTRCWSFAFVANMTPYIFYFWSQRCFLQLKHWYFHNSFHCFHSGKHVLCCLKRVPLIMTKEGPPYYADLSDILLWRVIQWSENREWAQSNAICLGGYDRPPTANISFSVSTWPDVACASEAGTTLLGALQSREPQTAYLYNNPRSSKHSHLKNTDIGLCLIAWGWSFSLNMP